MTHEQKMQASPSALKTYRLSLGPGLSHPDAAKTEAHMTWRVEYDAWLVAQRNKVQNGFAGYSDPPGMDTPPPPPTP